MQIDGTLLMPQMNPTNSEATGSHLIQKEGLFQAELNAAHKVLDQATKTGIMTDEQIEQTIF